MWVLLFFVFGKPALAACPEHIVGSVCHDEEGVCVLNPNGSEGGFVGKDAFVAMRKLPNGRYQLLTNHISRKSAVCGQARLLDQAKLLGENFVYERASIADRAILRGEAHVGGHASVLEDATIGGQAVIEGHVFVKDHAIVEGDVYLAGFVSVTEQVQIHGDVQLDTPLVLSGGRRIRTNGDIFSETTDAHSFTAESPSSTGEPCPTSIKPFVSLYVRGLDGLVAEVTRVLHPAPTHSLSQRRVQFYQNFLNGFLQARETLLQAHFNGYCILENELETTILFDPFLPVPLNLAYQQLVHDWGSIEATIGRMQDLLNTLSFDTSLTWQVAPYCSEDALQLLSMEWRLHKKTPAWLSTKIAHILSRFPMPDYTLSLGIQTPLFLWDPTPYRLMRDTLMKMTLRLHQANEEESAFQALTTAMHALQH